MTAGEIILIIAASAFVVGVVAWRIVRKMRGKGGSECGCSDCAGCKACAAKKEDGKK